MTEKRHLESRVVLLMTENKGLKQTCQQVSKQRELEVAELKAQLSKVRTCWVVVPLIFANTQCAS
jgi:hypothetical protein